MVKYSKNRGRFTTRSRNKRVRRYRTKILYGGVDYILDFSYKDMTYRIVLNENRYKLEENKTVIEICALTEFITKLFQISHTEVHRDIIDNIYNKLVLTSQQNNFRSLFDRLKEIKQNNGDIPLSKINPDLSSLITDKSIILGEGSFGKVYEVFIDGKKYALKVTNEATKELINQEIIQYNTISELVCDKDNKLFCKFIGAYCDFSQGKIYVLMEYCGNSLYDVIMSKILMNNIDELITGINNNQKKYIYTWLLNIAKGIKCMHENQYAHLDIKPRNIVVDEDLNSKLIDFGIILHINAEEISCRGSIYHLPPEMTNVNIAGYVNINGIGLLKCDIYSLGITFIECIYALTYPDIYKNTWDFNVFNGILRLDPKEKIEKDDTIKLLLVGFDNIKTIKRTMTKVILKKDGLSITYKELYDNIIDIHTKYPLLQRMIKINPDERCSIDDIITECEKELSKLTSISS